MVAAVAREGSGGVADLQTYVPGASARRFVSIGVPEP